MVELSENFGKILRVFALLFCVYAFFRLNVGEFFRQKEADLPQTQAAKKDFSPKIAILFENEAEKTAILLIPDGIKIDDFARKYGEKRALSGENLQKNTLYYANFDVECINQANCGEDFEKILQIAQKNQMRPKTLISGDENGY